MLWTTKYSPKTVAEFIGNEDASQEIRLWATSIESGKKEKPLLLSGAPGTGKTAVAKALAAEMGWEAIESDASRLRSAADIKQVLGASANYGSLFGSRRLLIVDEIGSTSDRGSSAALAALARESAQPIIFIANDAWDDAVRPLRFLTKPVEFRKLNSRSIASALRRIAKAEGMADGEYIDQIAKASAGDMRAALIDLQSSGGKAIISERERESGMFDAVRRTLKAESYAEALRAADGVDEEISTMLAWLCENVPIEYEDPAEVAKAFDVLSRSDVFLGHVRKSNDYSFWKYARALSLAGVALSKKAKYMKFAKYGFPSKLSKMSSSRGTRAALKSAGKKVGAIAHTSSGRAKKDILPYLSASGAEYFQLEKEEKGAIEDAYGKL
jgi:replication factor C large subunit